MPTILLRRGTTAEREAYTPLQGEIIFDTTTNHLYAGDGSTQGGLSVITINGKILDGAKNGIDLITLKNKEDTIGETATHTITNSYTEIITANITPDPSTSSEFDTPAVTLTGDTGSIVYVYFKTAGKRSSSVTRNITVAIDGGTESMVEGDIKHFVKTSDGWKLL